MQDLVGLRRNPGGGSAGSDLGRALQFHDPDFVRDRATGCWLRARLSDASQATQKNCGY